MAERKLPQGVYIRKDGRYEWRLMYAGVKYSGYADTVSEARKALSEKRYEVEHGMSSKERSISLDAWFNEWMDTYKINDCKDSTLYMYRNLYRAYIQPDFGKMQLKKIRHDMVQKFLNRLLQSHKKATVISVRNLLSACLRRAVKDGFISKNPAADVTLPKIQQEKKTAVTADDERAFLEAAKGSQYYDLYRLASLTGMRIGEVTGLQWNDIDFEKGIIHIMHTLSYNTSRGIYLDTPKTETSRRDIPFAVGGETYTLLKNRRKEQMSQRMRLGENWRSHEGLENLVFNSRLGSPVNASDVNKDMHKIQARLREQGVDLGDFSFHTLRHCFATRCIENGMNPKTLQMLLGHSDFSMTMNLYADALTDTQREELERVEAVL